MSKINDGMSEDFKIVAVVKMNDGEAIVLNRRPNMLYEFSGRDLVGSDGPFKYFYAYSAPSGRFKAFAGREFNIPLKDGGSVFANGQYWQGSIAGLQSVAYGTVDDLKECYVFSGGACVDPEAFAAMRAEYTGCVYPYWDYEKVIKFDAQRHYWVDRTYKLERDKKNLIKNVKAAHAKLSSVGAA